MTQRTRRPAGSAHFPIKSDVSGALEGGVQDVRDLQEEMEEWASNLESNNMEHLPKYEEVNEAKDVLSSAVDSLDSLAIPNHLEDAKVEFTIDTRRSAQSRSGRLQNAINSLTAAVDGARAWLEENEALEIMDDADAIEDGEEEITQEMVDERESHRDEAEAFADELENAISELENVNFPGMY